ncbi:MAG: PASTA domain-containing protein [Acidobacteriota bacterium]|nr:PASTA domain-containing protein [Acidobacteriota bacterium]
MALSNRVWSAGRVLVIGGALLGTYLLFAAAALRIAVRTREVPVPDLTGHSINDASALLADAGLTMRVEERRRVDPKVPPGHVITQDPTPGVTLRTARGVRVYVSAGARASELPSVAGQSERAATIQLEQSGITVSRVAEIRSAHYALDAVVAQDPPGASSSPSVELLVNRGERGTTYVMPDLIGLNGNSAAELLRATGFRVSVVGQQPYPGIPPGIVLRQSPQPGFQVAPGEPIALEVSR